MNKHIINNPLNQQDSENFNKRFIAKIPCGCGKTMIMKKFCEQYPNKK